MSGADFYDRVIEPPTPGMSPDESFRWLYDLWQRTGGYINFIPNLSGLQASVEELNTLVGIDTDVNVQTQLDGKVNTGDIGTLAEQDADNVNISGGIIVNTEVSGDLEIEVGSSNSFATTPGSLYGNMIAVGTVNGSENNLMSFNLLDNSLNVPGDYIEVDAWGTFAANANNKRVRLYFGGTVIFDTAAIAANDGSWWIKAKIGRISSATESAIASIQSSNSLVAQSTLFTNPTEDLTGNIIVKITGLGTSADDIIQQGFTVKWFAAA